MTRCPSQDWDRYIASQDGPMPVGEPRTVRSKTDNRCEVCGDVIPAGRPHVMQSYVDDEGLFISPARNHAPGECREPEPDDWDNLG